MGDGQTKIAITMEIGRLLDGICQFSTNDQVGND